MGNMKKENIFIIFLLLIYAVFLFFLATHNIYKGQKYNFFSMEKNGIDHLDGYLGKSCERLFYAVHKGSVIRRLEDKVYDVRFVENDLNKCIVKYKYKKLTSSQYIAIFIFLWILTLILLIKMRLRLSILFMIIIHILLFVCFIFFGISLGVITITGA